MYKHNKTDNPKFITLLTVLLAMGIPDSSTGPTLE